MEGLCWSRGTLSTVDIHLLNLLLLVAALLIASSLTHSHPVKRAAVSAVEELRLELGQQASFNCTNSSASQLVWFDGTLLLNSTHLLHGVVVTRMNSTAVTIIISNVTSYHYGNYSCVDSETGRHQATVALIPSRGVVSIPSDLITEESIEQGGSTVINCARGELLVKVDKEFHHSEITNDVLVVSLPEHQGKYLCLGNNNYPSMIHYVQLSGYRPLNITISPENIKQVPPYQNVDCLVTGTPGPITINWYYNNTQGWPIFSSGRIRVEQITSGSGYDAGLRLVLNSSFPDYDSGVYICVAKSDWEEVERSVIINFTIDSDVNIYIAYWPTSTLAVWGSSINITCYAVSVDNKLSIKLRFRKGNKTLSQVSSSKLNRYVTSCSLLLHNVSQSDNGVYSCQLLDIWDSDLRTGTLTVYKDPLHVVSFTFNKSSNGNISLICDVTIHEDFTHRLADIAVVFEQHDHIITPQLTFAANSISVYAVVREGGLYKCIATIDGISKSRTVSIEASNPNKDSSDQLKNTLLAGLGVVGFLCVIMCSLLFIICCQCPHKPNNTGYSNIMVSKSKIGARLSTNSCASADFAFKKSSSKNSLLTEWTIPFDALQFDCSLGSGAFGSVKKAYIMEGIGHKTPVAVKTLECGDASKEAFEKEVMILRRVGPHQHIIGLFGVCVQANEYFLVMELASRGNLLDYLCNKRTDKSQPLSVEEVLKFAKQIALGMEHLASQQCVHCDLAARNVLITGDNILKISDFGLARKLYSGVYVKDKSKRVRLPIRWTAPESMTELEFTSQSDIWSYGVVTWEIYQLGAVPYHSVSTHKLCSLLQHGLRLEKPQNCSPHHYQLMLSCWHGDPSCRPSFTEILQELSHLIATTSVEYINWNDDDYYSDCSTQCSDFSESSDVEDFCPVHGKSSVMRTHPVVKRNIPLKRKDSGLPDSPNDPFACKRDLQCNKTNNLLDETDV